MEKIIEIPVKKSGIKVKIGEIELWFDYSHEGLADYQTRTEKANADLEALDKEKEAAGVRDLTEDDSDEETYHEVIGFKKRELKAKYDSFFGEGTFDKLYAAYPDIMLLECAYWKIDREVSEVINERMADYEEQRKKEIDARRDNYLQKKMSKKDLIKMQFEAMKEKEIKRVRSMSKSEREEAYKSFKSWMDDDMYKWFVDTTEGIAKSGDEQVTQSAT